MVGSRVVVLVVLYCHVACSFANKKLYFTKNYIKTFGARRENKDLPIKELNEVGHQESSSTSPSNLTSTFSVLASDNFLEDSRKESISFSSFSSSLISFSNNHLIRRRSAQKTANVGGKVTMECELTVRDEKDYMIKWVKQGIEVPILIQVKKGTPPHIDSRYEGRIRVTNEANVELTKILLKDQGWYACTVMAINNSSDPGSATTNNSTWVHLTVNAPPVLGSVSPGFLRIKEGSSLDLFCEATGRPEPSVAWTKEGKEIISDVKYRLHNDGNSSRLGIEKSSKEDSGQYSCLFQNSIAQVSHNMRVVVEKEFVHSRNAYIVSRPRNTTAMEGNRVRMDCEADAHPKNLTYKWFKEGIDVHFVTGLMNRAGIHGDGSFVITHAKREDQGWYKCQPSNGIGSPPEATAYLNITYLPRVIKMEPSLYLPSGLPAKIDCITDGNPPARHIVWTKDEHLISDKNLRINKNGSLVLKQVRHSDQGQYACQPKSSLGEGQSSIPTQVFVKDPPHFTVRPQPIYQKFLGESVTMPCLAEGEPPPSISWRKVSGNETTKFKRPLPSHYQSIWHKHQENLSLYKLTKDDQGIYECVATSVVATVVTTTVLVVETSSRREPTSVTVRTTNTTATISWMPAYDSGQPHHYVLWYSKQDGEGESWTTLRIFQENSSTITIHDLKPSTPYRFMVFSRTMSGVGLFSKIMPATTKAISPKSFKHLYDEDEDRDDESEESGSGGLALEGSKMMHRELRPSPPYNLSVVNTKNGMVISWSPPRSLVPVHHYSLLYKTMGQWAPLVDDHPNTSYTWKTPSFGVTYLFRVVAYSAHNVASDSSRIISFDTGDPMPPEKTKLSYSMPLIIIGGMAVAIVTLVVAIIVGRWCRNRRQKASVRYGNVKYFGPNQAESIHRQNSRAAEALPVCSITEIEPVFMNENHTPSSNCFMHPPVVNDIKKIQETPI